MPQINYTDEVPLDSLSFSKVHHSRKSEARKYVYVKLDDQDLEIETPKLRVVDVHSVDGRCTVSLDLSADGQARQVKALLESIYQKFLEVGSERWRSQTRPPTVAPVEDTWRLRIGLQGAGRTLFFGSETKREIVDEPEKQLASASIKTIAVLDGIVIDDVINEIRPVWSVDQVLVYPEDNPNPFGGRYSFLDDDEGYLSLED